MKTKKLILFALMIILTINLVLAISIWDTESKLTSGSSLNGVQLNLDNTAICDAKRYIYLGYDYPGLDVDAPGVCDRCSGTGTEGIGSTSYVSLNDDPFSECAGVDCLAYYVQTGTESSTTTENCYDRANEPALTHYCSGSGDCMTAEQVCLDNAADTLKYSCGTCKYISASSCTGTNLGGCTNYAPGTSCGTGLECDGNGACVATCGGYLYNNECWYTSSSGASCDTICASHGGSVGCRLDIGCNVCKHFYSPGDTICYSEYYYTAPHFRSNTLTCATYADCSVWSSSFSYAPYYRICACNY